MTSNSDLNLMKNSMTISLKARRMYVKYSSRLGQENTLLIKEKQHLEAHIKSVQVELHAEKKLSEENVSLMKEKLIMATKTDLLEKELHAEKEVYAQIQAKLDLQYKKIHMFARAKQLDKILSYGRTEKSHRGLGYTGIGMDTSKPYVTSSGKG
ncbi:unnamed protein product [Arabis nemorensis]|uniref:Uncharacterized protein n=1 Tax=Arabis nemorensis TaxID=586526 RepID=A0A565BV44_9BRAS|nr:unnamed protein product [Arabis nemorensis]